MSDSETKRIPPLYDWMFQKVFGSEDSRDVAKALVNAVLDGVGLPKIKEIDEVKAEAAIPHSVSLRSPRTDVLLVSGDRLIDVEPQLYKTEYENKALYYAASLLVSHVGKGANGKSNERDAYSYSDFPQTVVIMFIKGRVKWPNSEQFVTVGRLHWELDGGFERGNDRIVFIFCEVDKVIDKYNKGMTPEVLADDLLTWLYVLGAEHLSDEEERKVMVENMSIAEFFERYNLALDDPDAWEAYRQHIISLLEDGERQKQAIRARVEGRAEGLAEGRAEGRAEGLAEGRAEERDRIIAVLKENGVSEELVSRI